MEAGSTHLGPGSYNTHKYKSIDPGNKNGHKFGNSIRKPLRDTENVPGVGTYNFSSYKNSKRGGYTFNRSAKSGGRRNSSGAKLYDTRGNFPDTASYALPKP
jgi:hypothetical protein